MMKLKTYMFKNKLNIILKYLIIFLFAILFYNFYNLNSIRITSLNFNIFSSRINMRDFNIMKMLYYPLLETIFLAISSTIFGIFTTIFILPIQINILFNKKIFPKIFSSIFSIARTIPSLIIAAILVSLFSVGNFSGFLCLYIISVLMSSKILKEIAEETNEKNLKTLYSLGFSKFKIYRIILKENLKPNIMSVFFLVLESNIRGASILGLVGAGGIGRILWRELNYLRYSSVILIICILIVIIALIDLISYFFRKYAFIFSENRYSKVFYFVIFLINIILFFKIINIDLDKLHKGISYLKIMLIGIVSIDYGYISKSIFFLTISIIISFTSTFVASIIVVFLSYFYFSRFFNKYFTFCIKIMVNIFRTIPPVISSIFFFCLLGPGYLSSFFALLIYTVGVMTKMFGEIIENKENNVLLYLKSLGISDFLCYKNVLFKEYFPEFISIMLYRFEMNIKNSTILGMVGAGGIGQLLSNNIEFRNWSRVSIILILLSLTVIFIENISYYVRIKLKK